MTTVEQPTNTEPVDEAEERAFLEQRDHVSDEELVARLLAAPDCGGELLIELSEFVARRSIPGAR